MSEKYIIEENQDKPINIGNFVRKVHAKQSKDYGVISADKTRDRVKKVFKNCMKQINMIEVNNNVLLIGKVQSGKTSNLEMFTAFAFDNGYKCVIIYGGYDNKLLSQTSDRFRKTFDVSEDSIDSTSPELFSTDDSAVDSLDEDVLNNIIELEKPIIFVSMKRPVALKKINKILSKISKKNLQTFVIDDEGDQASLNTEFKKNKESATYSEICTMKQILSDPLYISVTATPQANVLLGEYSSLQPARLYLIEPGNGYTGAEFFHLNEDRIANVESEDAKELEEGRIPNSIYDSVHYFLVASTIMKIMGNKYTDMIIHTSRTNKEHSNLYQTIYQYVQALKDNVRDNDPDLDIQFNEIIKIYNTKYFSNYLINRYKINDILNELKDIIKNTHIILQDSNGKNTQGNEKYRQHKIYIGGDLLQRGLTFKNLITTYFTRWPKKSGNMDTIIQRARWFGYRSKYLDLCKIFTTSKIQEEYSGLTESENDLWEQCYSIENGEMEISDIVIDASSSTLNPTRKNVAHYKNVKFTKKWNNQKTGVFNKEINVKNNAVIEHFIEGLSLIPSTKGRIGSNTPSCYYGKCSRSDFLNLIDNTQDIFNKDPFNIKDLKKISSCYDIVVQKMYDLENLKEVRKRTFNQDTLKVYALQQGPDKAEKELQHYEGDSSVIVDENALTIQIFRILPRFDINKEKELKEYIQYMFSIHIPESRKGFVKDEFKKKN